MAYYTDATLYYRGRRLRVTLRYGSYMSHRIESGKPLEVTEKDERRIMALIARKPETRSALEPIEF